MSDLQSVRERLALVVSGLGGVPVPLPPPVQPRRPAPVQPRPVVVGSSISSSTYARSAPMPHAKPSPAHPAAYRHVVERDAFNLIVSVTSFPITPEQADEAAAKFKDSPFYRGTR